MWIESVSRTVPYHLLELLPPPEALEGYTVADEMAGLDRLDR